jgi:hypothetical protein
MKTKHQFIKGQGSARALACIQPRRAVGTERANARVVAWWRETAVDEASTATAGAAVLPIFRFNPSTLQPFNQ